MTLLTTRTVVYLQVIESPQRMKLAAAPGQRLPVFCTATGKGFLAFLSKETVEQILKSGLPKYTEYTKTKRSAIFDELEVIRERGFAISQQEYEEGVNAVAAPILDGKEYPVAAMAIVGPAFRLPQERLVELGKAVRVTADAIARDLGLAFRIA